MKQWLGQELEGQVYWIDTAYGPQYARGPGQRPIDVGPALEEQLYSQVPTVVMTSATLSTGGKAGFRHIQERLGLDGCDALHLGSPFNFREQVELHLFRRMPDPSSDPAGYEEAVLAKIPEYIQTHQGEGVRPFYQLSDDAKGGGSAAAVVCSAGVSAVQSERRPAALADDRTLPGSGQRGAVRRR